MKSKPKLYIARTTTVFLVILLLAFLAIKSTTERSALHDLISPYQKGAEPWTPPETVPFADGTAEEAFLRGMTLFDAGDHAGALPLFEQAELLPASDPALPAYLCFYRNECIYRTQGFGSPELVAEGLEAAGRYEPLTSNGKLVWGMVQTIAFGEDSGAQAVALMEEYLHIHRDLEIPIWATLKNAIGMLQYLRQSYAMSIRNFYDVQIRLESMESLTPELRQSLDYALQSIANLYQLFGEYDIAIILYQNAAESAAPSQRYGNYLNISAACISIGDLERAREFALKVEDSLPDLDSALVPDIQAHICGTLANISMMEGNYDAADTYITAAEDIYQQEVATVFHGGPQLITVYRCRHMLHAGDAATAVEKLEGLMESGEAALYGVEADVCYLLLDGYAATGQDELIPKVYQHLLELDAAFQDTIQREYIEFSMYYRDTQRLSAENASLTRVNTVAIALVLLITSVLILVLLVARGLRRKAVIDPLTGVYNRKMLNTLMRRYRRTGTPERFCVLMLDIDYFKRYNDTYGHPAGDTVIKTIARTLKDSVRSKDLVIRYGGEEFLVLLYGLQAGTAADVCRRIQRQLEELAIPHETSDAANHVTVSMGLCYHPNAGSSALSDLIQQADECLYQSKQEGRNCYTMRER